MKCQTLAAQSIKELRSKAQATINALSSDAEAKVEAVIEIKYWTNVLKHFSQPKLKQNTA